MTRIHPSFLSLHYFTMKTTSSRWKVRVHYERRISTRSQWWWRPIKMGWLKVDITQSVGGGFPLSQQTCYFCSLFHQFCFTFPRRWLHPLIHCLKLESSLKNSKRNISYFRSRNNRTELKARGKEGGEVVIQFIPWLPSSWWLCMNTLRTKFVHWILRSQIPTNLNFPLLIYFASLLFYPLHFITAFVLKIVIYCLEPVVIKGNLNKFQMRFPKSLTLLPLPPL